MAKKDNDSEELIEQAEADDSGDEAKQEKEHKETKKQKPKKVVRKRKSKKEKESPALSAIRLAVETGKVAFGVKSIFKEKNKKVKLLVVANNLPFILMKKINDFQSSSSVPILHFDGSSISLGSVCGCPYPVSVLSVFDPGSSSVIELVKKR